ncbi:MAG: hypothetical protein ACLTNP_03105 [Streptococcus salivarius]
MNARLFDRDDRYPLIASLELEELDENDSSKVVFVKSDAFKKPTIRPKKHLHQVMSAVEALNVSLSEGRGVDLNLMSSVYPDVSEDMMISELGETVMIEVERYIDDKTVHYVTKLNSFQVMFLLNGTLTLIETEIHKRIGNVIWN